MEDGPVETCRPASISDELIGSEGVIASLIKDDPNELKLVRSIDDIQEILN